VVVDLDYLSFSKNAIPLLASFAVPTLKKPGFSLPGRYERKQLGQSAVPPELLAGM
jgi:hypothetical protein